MLIKAGADVDGSPDWDSRADNAKEDPPSFPLIAALRIWGGPVYKSYWNYSCEWNPSGYIDKKRIGYKTCALENIKILVEAGADVNCSDGSWHGVRGGDGTALGWLLGQILRRACA